MNRKMLLLLAISGTMSASSVLTADERGVEPVSLNVHLESSGSSFLFGQPVLLYVAVENTGAKSIRAWNVVVDGYEPEIALFVSADGKSFEKYQMGLFGFAEIKRTFVEIRPGQPLRYAMRIVYARKEPSRLAFPETGDYWLKVRYPRMAPPEAERSEHESNVIKISVKEPKGTDAQVWKAIKAPEFIRFLQSGSESPDHPGLAIRAAELLDSVEQSSYHPALRYAVGAYYFKKRAIDCLDYTRREPFGSTDIRGGELLRRVLKVQSESYGLDWRLIRCRVAGFPKEATTVAEAVDFAWKVTGVPLAVAPNLRAEPYYAIPDYDATLGDFMQSAAMPGRSTWLRDGCGYRLVPTKEVGGVE